MLKKKKTKKVLKKKVAKKKFKKFITEKILEHDPIRIVGPTNRWTELKYHPEQYRYIHSDARFKVNHSGRRSGKTEILKREGVEEALRFYKYHRGRVIFTAPTHRQAKKIYWDDLKDLVPKWFIKGKPSESELVITLKNNCKIDWIGLDEFGNMKKTVWGENIRPALSDRLGKARFIGVPEGRNHYFRLRNEALDFENKDWDVFHWNSEDIIDVEEIEAAKRDLDPLTYQQEYCGDFINFEGRAYHSFETVTHAFKKLHYRPNEPLILTFDFNVKPGTANVLQEQVYQGKRSYIASRITACIDEIHIEQNSNTVKVCQKFLAKYREHKGSLFIYGDATGGAKGTAKVQGSDWDLVKQCLKPVFGNRLSLRVKKANPRERVRLNAFNSRLKSMDGTVKFLIDPQSCPHTIIDLEGVSLKQDGSGELDKKADETLTHHTDGIGYYIESKHPLPGGYISDVIYGM